MRELTWPMTDDVLAILTERGFVQQISDEAGLRARLASGITLYCGYDATADSLTAGHLVTMMMLSWFQRCGHRPIALMGGGTTLVGDPSDRNSSRPILAEADIARNVEAIRGQMSHFLDFSDGRALMLNNADWLTTLKFTSFMREIGSRFSINEVFRLDAYRTRLEAGGMTFLELSYVLMQSYDFLRLYEDHHCILQVGGSDQWGNSITGADLIRRVTGGEAYVLVAPLLTTADGAKMGKTAAGAVWLDPRRTSPYDYYQYWRNIEDSLVEKSLAIFTYLPMDEVRSLAAGEGAALNEAKRVLAFAATSILHGEEEARRAQEAAQSLFGGGGAGDAVPTVEMDRARLEGGLTVTDLFKEAGLVSSANEARNLIAQKGLSLAGEPVTDPRAPVSDALFRDGGVLLSRGRKRHMRVVLV